MVSSGSGSFAAGSAGSTAGSAGSAGCPAGIDVAAGGPITVDADFEAFEALEFLRLYPVVAKRCEANDKKSRRVSTQYA